MEGESSLDPGVKGAVFTGRGTLTVSLCPSTRRTWGTCYVEEGPDPVTATQPSPAQ